MDDFRPARGLRGAFRQTVFGALWPVRYPRGVPPPVRREVEMHDGERLAALVTPAAARPARGRLLLLHGLGGSANSRYMLRTLAHAWSRGYEVARLQFRGAEEGRPCGRSFHNAGRSGDLAAVLEQLVWCDGGDPVSTGPDSASRRGVPPPPLVAIGFSLGGAVLLKYLGEAGSRAPIGAAAAVSAPLDLAACLAELERPRNRVYHDYYVRRLRRQVRATLAAHPGSWPALERSTNAVRKIDTRYVAPDAGYDSAEAYYRGASSLPLLGDIAVPTLLLSSRDDPFIPAPMFEGLPRNGAPIETLLTARGGHVGYLGRGARKRRDGSHAARAQASVWPGDAAGSVGPGNSARAARVSRGMRFWAGEVVLDWMETGRDPRVLQERAAAREREPGLVELP